MRVSRSRLIAVATVGLLAACAGNWIAELERPVPCTRDRAQVVQYVGRAGGRIDAGYAWVEFAANTFSDSTRVEIRPFPGLHGIQLTLPSESAMPAFDIGFPVDFCGDRPDDDTYYIVTRDGPRPARVMRGVAQRHVEAGELADRVSGAAMLPSRSALVSGFVILSN